MTQVEYPQQRAELISCLAALADIDYQRRTWRSDGTGGEASSEMNDVINDLYEISGMDRDFEKRIGKVLAPGDEIKRLRQLHSVLAPVLADHRDDADEVVIRDSRWAEVCQAACLVLAAMVRGSPDPGR